MVRDPPAALARRALERIARSRFWHGGWQNRSGGKLNPLARCAGGTSSELGR